MPGGGWISGPCIGGPDSTIETDAGAVPGEAITGEATDHRQQGQGSRAAPPSRVQIPSAPASSPEEERNVVPERDDEELGEEKLTSGDFWGGASHFHRYVSEGNQRSYPGRPGGAARD